MRRQRWSGQHSEPLAPGGTAAIPAPMSASSALRRYDLAIFDFDGVLANSEQWARGVFDEVAKRHKFKRVSDEEIEMLRSRSSREIIRYLGIPPWRLPAIGRHMRRLSADKARDIPPFPGVDDLFSSLAGKGVRIVVVTSNGEQTVRDVLGEANSALIERFECGAAMFGKHRRFRKAVRHTGVAPRRVLCIGDETRDIEAATRAGLDSAAVAWGYASPEALMRVNPTYMATDMAALARLF